MIPSCIAIFAVALLFSGIFTPLMGGLGRTCGLVDHPDKRLKNHPHPTPYLGGIALWCGISASLLLSLFFFEVSECERMVFVGLWIGATIMLIAGLVDDIHDLPPLQKIILQVIVALFFVVCEIRLTIEVLPDAVNVLLTIIWVVAIINAFNMIDIKDGLAAGIAAVAGAGFFVHSLISQDVVAMIFSLALTGATLGFIWYNLSPASIFMGDAGSMCLGAVLAGLSMTLGYTSVNELGLLSPLLILIVPIYEICFLVIARYKEGVSILKGSVHHVVMQLAYLGLNEKKAVSLMWGVSAFFGALTLLIVRLTLTWAIILYAIIVVLLIGLAWKLERGVRSEKSK